MKEASNGRALLTGNPEVARANNNVSKNRITGKVALPSVQDNLELQRIVRKVIMINVIGDAHLLRRITEADGREVLSVHVV